jgi:(p)ppGpp synthase/HD superfamily hydrolase
MQDQPMDTNRMLSMAISLSASKFVNVLDKGGNPYILHCLKVMHYTRSDDPEILSIAAMHDLVEDTDVTYQELRDMGFSKRVIEGVRCMTKVPGETAEEYFEKVSSNPDAVIVKMADLRHNSDIRRLKGVTEKDIRRIEKYQKMYQRLKTLIESPSGGRKPAP